jgi:hypothetical protein
MKNIIFNFENNNPLIDSQNNWFIHSENTNFINCVNSKDDNNTMKLVYNKNTNQLFLKSDFCNIELLQPSSINTNLLNS